MYKVLLIAEDFRYYNQSFKRCFEANNCETLLHISRGDLEIRDYFARIKKRFGFKIDKFLEKKRNKESNIAWKVFKEFQPDLVYVIKGTQINARTIKEMSKSARTVLCMWDTIVQFPILLDVVGAYDIVYSFQESDIELLQKKDINALPLMGDFDDNEYFPLNNEKEIDVIFVGAMYPDRRRILGQLLKDFPDLRLEFYGEYARFRHPIRYIKWFFSTEKEVFKNINIPPKQVNELYNKSKICLNLQLNTINSGWNSKLVEILGTESFQLVNENPIIKNVFKDELVLFTDYEDLKNKIVYYLNNVEECKLIASKGYKYVKSNFTRVRAIGKVLNDVKTINK